jgi:hypothetical protein
LQKDKSHSYYLVFSTIHEVLKAEKRLKEHGFAFELIPIPRNLSSDCGSCIRLYDDLEKVMECMDNIKVERRFLYDGKEYRAVN